MKIVHVPYGFFPDVVGGTEVYVASLAAHLQARGIDVVIAAPADEPAIYAFEGLRVRRFRVAPDVRDVGEIYGEGDEEAARALAALVDEEQPDLVHLHAHTRAVSLRAVRELRSRGLPVVFTYHTPTMSCQRGTLMRWGIEPCDGRMEAGRCARCALHGHGVGRVAAEILGRTPAAVGDLLRRANRAGGAWTALRMPHLVAMRQAAAREFLNQVDRVVAPCRWVADLLAGNAVPRRKIELVRHGLPTGAVEPAAEPAAPGAAGSSRPIPRTASEGRRAPLRMAYVGRMTPSKGPDLVIEVLRRLPDLPVAFDVYGVVQDPGGERYLESLRRLAAGDDRVTFRGSLPHDQVVSTLQDYDVLAVPSRWLEIGPLVVLEAFAAGTPVLGSELGGIAELVRHGEDGVLLQPDSIADWSAALRSLCENPSMLRRIRAGVRPPRRMADVAEEMLSVYERCLPGSIPTSRRLVTVA